jgi:hypothetical protein
MLLDSEIALKFIFIQTDPIPESDDIGGACVVIQKSIRILGRSCEASGALLYKLYPPPKGQRRFRCVKRSSARRFIHCFIHWWKNFSVFGRELR